MKIASAPQPVLQELGSKKTVTQHLGNAGFGASSVAAFGESLETLVDASSALPGADLVPGLNLGVAAVESYNTIQKLRRHEPVVAAMSAGNATGTMGTFLGQLSIMTDNAALGAVGAGFGAVGGALGITAGIAEIREGIQVRQRGGSSRLLAMGCLDITSGLVSLSGAGLLAAGAGPVGIGLMMSSNVIDLAGIGVDYLWKKKSQTQSETGPPSTSPSPKSQA